MGCERIILAIICACLYGTLGKRTIQRTREIDTRSDEILRKGRNNDQASKGDGDWNYARNCGMSIYFAKMPRFPFKVKYFKLIFKLKINFEQLKKRINLTLNLCVSF